jgi:flagellar motor switch protein FliN
MTSHQPLDWIQQVDAHLVALDEKPQFGTFNSLDWGRLEEDLRKLLNRPEITITHTEKGWIAPGQILAGLGENIIYLPIEWSPLSSTAFFVTGELNIKELMSNLLATEEETPFFYEPALVDGFYSYFAAEILRLISKQQFASPLSPRIGPQTENGHYVLEEESCFAIDISMQLNGRHLWGRVLLSESFRREWKKYFALQKPPALTKEMREKLMVEIGLEVGKSRLKNSEWKKVKAGDFVILDHCSYDPDEKSGSVVLTLQQKPFFRAKIKKGEIKLTHYPVYEEVTNMMEDEPLQRQSNSDKSEADDLYGDLDLDDESEFDEDEEFNLEETVTETDSSAEHPISSGTQIPLEEIPVQLTIEVGRVKMTAGMLAQLAPGNLLDLHVAPEQGVDLVLNGRKVGRGELIRMGDVLGVRILAI